MGYNLAQSDKKVEIAPGYRFITWRNLPFFLTLRHYINIKNMERTIIGREKEKNELLQNRAL